MENNHSDSFSTEEEHSCTSSDNGSEHASSQIAQIPPPAVNELDFVMHNFLHDYVAKHPPSSDIRSELLTVGAFTCRLIIFPSGSSPATKESSPHLSVYIEAVPQPNWPPQWRFVCNFQIFVFNQADLSKSIYLRDQFVFTESTTNRGWSAILSHQKIMRSHHGDGFLSPEGSLHLRLSISPRPDATEADSSKIYEMCQAVGIENLGATCYLNSVLQSLFFLKKFRELIFSIPTDKIENTKDRSESVCSALQHLFWKLMTSRTSITTSRLVNSFGWSSEDTSLQHDAQELSRLLFDKIEMEIKCDPECEKMLNSIYRGELESYIQCTDVPYTSSRKENYYDIPLQVDGMESFEAAMYNEFVNSELLANENQYDAGPQYGKQNAYKGMRLLSTPPVLQFHFKRFKFDIETLSLQKINDYFPFPVELNMEKYCKGSGKFILYSVVVHSGSVNGGHYITYVRKHCTVNIGDGEKSEGLMWIRCDDDVISPCTKYAAVDDNFGGKDFDNMYDYITYGYPNRGENSKNKLYSAYMVTYIEERYLEEYCVSPSLDEIPSALIDKLQQEENEIVHMEKKQRTQHQSIHHRRSDIIEHDAEDIYDINVNIYDESTLVRSGLGELDFSPDSPGNPKAIWSVGVTSNQNLNHIIEYVAGKVDVDVEHLMVFVLMSKELHSDASPQNSNSQYESTKLYQFTYLDNVQFIPARNLVSYSQQITLLVRTAQCLANNSFVRGCITSNVELDSDTYFTHYKQKVYKAWCDNPEASLYQINRNLEEDDEDEEEEEEEEEEEDMEMEEQPTKQVKRLLTKQIVRSARKHMRSHQNHIMSLFRNSTVVYLLVRFFHPTIQQVFTLGGVVLGVNSPVVDALKYAMKQLDLLNRNNWLKKEREERRKRFQLRPGQFTSSFLEDAEDVEIDLESLNDDENNVMCFVEKIGSSLWTPYQAAFEPEEGDESRSHAKGDKDDFISINVSKTIGDMKLSNGEVLIFEFRSLRDDRPKSDAELALEEIHQQYNQSIIPKKSAAISDILYTPKIIPSELEDRNQQMFSNSFSLNLDSLGAKTVEFLTNYQIDSVVEYQPKVNSPPHPHESISKVMQEMGITHTQTPSSEDAAGTCLYKILKQEEHKTVHNPVVISALPLLLCDCKACTHDDADYPFDTERNSDSCVIAKNRDELQRLFVNKISSELNDIHSAAVGQTLPKNVLLDDSTVVSYHDSRSCSLFTEVELRIYDFITFLSRQRDSSGVITINNSQGDISSQQPVVQSSAEMAVTKINEIIQIVPPEAMNDTIDATTFCEYSLKLKICALWKTNHLLQVIANLLGVSSSRIWLFFSYPFSLSTHSFAPISMSSNYIEDTAVLPLIQAVKHSANDALHILVLPILSPYSIEPSNTEIRSLSVMVRNKHGLSVGHIYTYVYNSMQVIDAMERIIKLITPSMKKQLNFEPNINNMRMLDVRSNVVFQIFRAEALGITAGAVESTCLTRDKLCSSIRDSGTWASPELVLEPDWDRHALSVSLSSSSSSNALREIQIVHSTSDIITFGYPMLLLIDGLSQTPKKIKKRLQKVLELSDSKVTSWRIYASDWQRKHVSFLKEEENIDDLLTQKSNLLLAIHQSIQSSKNYHTKAMLL